MCDHVFQRNFDDRGRVKLKSRGSSLSGASRQRPPSPRGIFCLTLHFSTTCHALKASRNPQMSSVAVVEASQLLLVKPIHMATMHGKTTLVASFPKSSLALVCLRAHVYVRNGGTSFQILGILAGPLSTDYTFLIPSELLHISRRLR